MSLLFFVYNIIIHWFLTCNTKSIERSLLISMMTKGATLIFSLYRLSFYKLLLNYLLTLLIFLPLFSLNSRTMFKAACSLSLKVAYYSRFNKNLNFSQYLYVSKSSLMKDEPIYRLL